MLEIMYVTFILWTIITFIYFVFDDEGTKTKFKGRKMIILIPFYLILELTLLIVMSGNVFPIYLGGVIYLLMIIIVPIISINLINRITEMVQ